MLNCRRPSVREWGIGKYNKDTYLLTTQLYGRTS